MRESFNSDLGVQLDQFVCKSPGRRYMRFVYSAFFYSIIIFCFSFEELEFCLPLRKKKKKKN